MTDYNLNKRYIHSFNNMSDISNLIEKFSYHEPNESVKFSFDVSFTSANSGIDEGLLA